MQFCHAAHRRSSKVETRPLLRPFSEYRYSSRKIRDGGVDKQLFGGFFESQQETIRLADGQVHVLVLVTPSE